MQSRVQSFIESLTNIMIGYMVALLSQLLIFPLFDIDVSLSENLLIGLYFTIISIARSYMVRRYFNWSAVNSAQTHIEALKKKGTLSDK